jgi:hypothetical protein
MFSCKTPSTKNDELKMDDTTQATQNNENLPSQPDTLRDPSHYYYLTDFPLIKVGQLILADSVQPLDNKIIFDCMDSLSSMDTKTRDFYFPVFLKILEKSDGALAEAVGQYAMNYIEKYPKEFAIKSRSITDDQFTSFASSTGYELYFSFETVQKATSWTNSIIKNCANCDKAELKRLKEFNMLALEAMKDIDEH